MQKQLRVIFSGHVQGVGFRFTTERIARQFPVSGYVKNLRDGRVELVAEGEESILQDFLVAVSESKMQNYIRDREVTWSGAQGTFSNFEITF